jgi:hypothetical protein
VGVLSKEQVDRVHHFAPLHYLPFIGRSKSLLCKPSLRKAGFPPAHLRSTSSRQDIARGFGCYIHLTLHQSPAILKAKLAAGFPHVGIVIPAKTIEAIEFSLCRFNIAMTRNLRRNERTGFPESPTNGRYYGQRQIPIARNDGDKAAMLKRYLNTNTVIEVLIHGDLALPDDIDITCFAEEDAKIARAVLSKLGALWRVVSVPPPIRYQRKASHVRAVSRFIEQALAEPDWRGNSLEFDRL